MTTSLKQYLVLAGDILILYGCLLITLLVRHGHITAYLWHAHAGPFAIVFTLWIIIFYINGLYDLRSLKNTTELINQVIVATFAGSIVAITLFYLIPYFKISPKTNLVIFILIFTLVEILWRWLFNSLIKKPGKRIIVVGRGPELEELITFINDNPQLGYDVCLRIEDVPQESMRSLTDLIQEHEINSIIVAETIKDNDEFIREIYRNVLRGVEVVGAMQAHESILQKLPIADTERLWILTNITKNQRVYELVKYPIEYVTAIALFLTILPLMILIGIIVKLTSRGPIIYKQIRIGKNEESFFIYKFRTMTESAEKDGPQWSRPNDTRVTPFGKLLRASHLDELPQLINILRREVSFVGPRPERPEFVKDLKDQIPYYEIRHIVKPGITGWAQINYRYGSSTEDAYHKLQYDLFYIKNRSLILDFLIIVKTLKLFFTNVE